MFGLAIAEFEFTLTFANAPFDQFARGQRNALTNDEKQGALLFFGKARCIECHSVAGESNEMFSDFKDHVIGVPQIAPKNTNNAFNGPDKNEDFGLEQITAKLAGTCMRLGLIGTTHPPPQLRLHPETVECIDPPDSSEYPTFGYDR